MKPLKLKKKFSLKKEKIVTLNQDQLKNVKGGGAYTWITCPVHPTQDCWSGEVFGEY